MLVAFCVLTLVFSFFFRASQEDFEPLKKTIDKYILLLSDGYRDMNLTPLRGVATEKECDKTYIHMAAFGESRKRIDSKIKKIDFLRFEKVSESKFKVETEEVWDYSHIDIDTSKVSQEFKDVSHRMQYTLEKIESKWFVDSVEFKDAKSGAASAQ